MKPHVLCHMVSSIDGRILHERWRPNADAASDLFETIHDKLGGDAWVVGRVTGQEFAKRSEPYPKGEGVGFAREDHLPKRGADAYGVVLDAAGKIAWGRADIGGDPIVVVLTEDVSDAHLAGLRSDGVGYLFAGKDEIDLALLLAKLEAALGVKRLLLEGGGGVNGSFLRAGLVDEISLVVCPAVDGAKGAPAVFDSSDEMEGATAGVRGLALESHEVLDGGAVWLRYKVEPTA
ncbi:dihydrofolate reductase family protein [Aureimonas psammosilenae]|uniref:dihydrofolate reductase family protein n=1 Tax=Aureimonas psammosilenae TaxID=2495496 RepID=UPI0012610C4D|nr:dihydrofolate reductase family protein [Aureimonas psammosilenae]